MKSKLGYTVKVTRPLSEVERRGQADLRLSIRRASDRTRLGFPHYLSAEGKAASRRKKLYGLSERDFNTLCDRQHFACAICRTAPETTEGQAKPLLVDHRHEKGMGKFQRGLIRGLLCQSCNLLIGHAEDSIERLQRAAQYLLETQDGAPISSNEWLKHEGIRVRPFTPTRPELN